MSRWLTLRILVQWNLPQYFVVRVDGVYVVWEMTPQQLYERVGADMKLVYSLDQHPFGTRAEAEERRDALNAARAQVA